MSSGDILYVDGTQKSSKALKKVGGTVRRRDSGEGSMPDYRRRCRILCFTRRDALENLVSFS